MRYRVLVILPVLAVLLLAACSPGVETAAPAEVPSEAQETVSSPAQVETEAEMKPTDAQAVTATEAPPEADAPPTEVPPTAEAAVVEDASAPACTSKTGLAATDPASVSLASGEVQLIEFFAFW